MTDELPPLLPPFPVDDGTLRLVDEAINSSIDYVDGKQVRTGGGFGLGQLLEMLSGYDASLLEETDNPDVMYYPLPMYSYADVIESLVAEVRRLRAGTEWQVRWRDEDGNRQSKRFGAEESARRFATESKEWARDLQLRRRSVSRWEVVEL